MSADSVASNPKFLTGYRVLDLSRILAGPWASQLLADMGAEVLKIERPGNGDDTRGWGPPFYDHGDGAKDAAYFTTANRGKKSLTIDFTKAEGQTLIHELAAHCDIVLENFKLDGLKKYQLDYASLKAIKPDIIYCSITGFGQTGPLAARAGYDFLIQAMGGLMSITGQPDDTEGGGPVKVGVALADILTGLYAANGIQAALLHRERTGQGSWIDLSLLDTQVASLANQATNYLASGVVPGRLGNAHPNIVPYEAFATMDGHIILAVGNDRQFAAFCAVAGKENLSSDLRYASNAARVANREDLIPQIRTIMATKSSADWIALLEDAGVPCGPINGIDEVFAQPQIQQRGMKIDRSFGAHDISLVANPLQVNGQSMSHEEGPPRLGQHTDQLLQDMLDIDAADLAALKDKGVI